jgi:multiple antibiotic resistance protein
MAPYFELFLTTLAGFFAIMNPLANAPIFLGLTQGFDTSERRKTALRAVLVAFFVVAVFSLLGQVLFSVFGITVASFRVAGGLIVFSIGFKMLEGRPSTVHHTKRAVAAARADGAMRPLGSASSGADAEVDDALSVAVSPLGVPLLAGPGTIATAVGFSAGDWAHASVTLAAFLLLCIVTWLTFLGAERVLGLFGRAFLPVITRLMGLILAVIGTQMFLLGLHEAGY